MIHRECITHASTDTGSKQGSTNTGSFFWMKEGPVCAAVSAARFLEYQTINPIISKTSNRMPVAGRIMEFRPPEASLGVWEAKTSSGPACGPNFGGLEHPVVEVSLQRVFALTPGRPGVESSLSAH